MLTINKNLLIFFNPENKESDYPELIHLLAICRKQPNSLLKSPKDFLVYRKKKRGLLGTAEEIFKLHTGRFNVAIKTKQVKTAKTLLRDMKKLLEAITSKRELLNAVDNAITKNFLMYELFEAFKNVEVMDCINKIDFTKYDNDDNIFFVVEKWVVEKWTSNV